MLRDGVQQLARSQAHTAYADTLLALGSALRRAGAREEVREPPRDALFLAERGGVGLLAVTAEAELRATGARPRRRSRLAPGRSRLPSTASHALPPTASPTARSPRTLFVTPKTVETHLGHVYAKLDIPGRTALAGALRTRLRRVSARHARQARLAGIFATLTDQRLKPINPAGCAETPWREPCVGCRRVGAAVGRGPEDFLAALGPHIGAAA